MGEFAIWAITDLSTGEIQYVVDDSWGSEILATNFGQNGISQAYLKNFKNWTSGTGAYSYISNNRFEPCSAHDSSWRSESFAECDINFQSLLDNI